MSAQGANPPLPHLDDPRDVPLECAEQLRESGHTCLRNLASPAETAAYRPALERAAALHALDKRPLAERDTYGRAFLQSHNLWLRDATARAFVLAARFAHAAATLLGVPAVRLYHDQALVKEAGGGPTPWHQDQFYWPLATDDTLTLWMPLRDVDERVGSMTFAAGSHRLGHLGDYAIGDASERAFATRVREHGLSLETHGALSAGDATFHKGWTLHRADANPTSQARPAMTIIYFADGTRTAALDHPSRRVDHALYLPECRPGEPTASRFTPRLFPRDGALPVAIPEHTASERAALREALGGAYGGG